MKKRKRKLNHILEDILKRCTGEITTDKRFFCIAIILLVLTVANIAYTVRCIYRMGKKDAERELIHIQYMSKQPLQPDNLQPDNLEPDKPHSFPYPSSEEYLSESDKDSLEINHNEMNQKKNNHNE